MNVGTITLLKKSNPKWSNIIQNRSCMKRKMLRIPQMRLAVVSLVVLTQFDTSMTCNDEMKLPQTNVTSGGSSLQNVQFFPAWTFQVILKTLIVG